LPITWNNIDNGKGIEVIIAGDISTQEILLVMNEISQDDTLNDRTWELWDFSTVGDFDISSDDIQLITESDKKFIESKKGLFIKVGAHSKDLTFGMGRVYEAYSVSHPNVHIRAFWSRTEAVEWINKLLQET